MNSPSLPDHPAESRLRPAAFWGAVAVLAVVHAILAWIGRQPAVTTGHDDALYLILARSLLRGSYQELHYVPVGWHAQYPPGYPALLAMTRLVFGESINAFTGLSVVCSTLALVLVCDGLRRTAGQLPALAMMAAAAVNPLLLNYAGEVSSEAAFTAAVAAALWALSWPVESRGRTLLAGAAAVGACMIRSAGLPLLVAVGLYWLVQRRFRAVVALGMAGLLTFGAWVVWTIKAPHQAVGRSYVADLRLIAPEGGGMPSMFLEMHDRMTQYLTSALPNALSLASVQHTYVDNAIHMVLIVTLLVIGVVAAWRSWRALSLFLLAYGGLLVAWPWIQTRFVVPVVPAVWAGLLLGALALDRRVGHAAGLLLGGVLVASAAVGGARRTFGEARWWDCDRANPTASPTCFQEDQRSYFAAAAWAREHTPADAIFLTSKDATWYYYTDRRVIRSVPVREVAVQRLGQYLADQGVSYIVLGNVKASEAESLNWMFRPLCRSLEVAASFPPRTFVFRLRSEPGDDTACRALVAYRASLRFSNP